MYVCLYTYAIWVGEKKKKKSVTVVKIKARGKIIANLTSCKLATTIKLH